MLLEAAQDAGRTKDGVIADLKQVVSGRNLTIEEMTIKMREHEASRRKLHNTIQELKVPLHPKITVLLFQLKFIIQSHAIKNVLCIFK